VNKAPLIKVGSGTRERLIWPAYEAWRLHYEACAECNRQDWYDPETAKLCLAGVRAFNKWSRASMSAFGRAVVEALATAKEED